MTTLRQYIPAKAVLSMRGLLWLAAVAILATLLTLLTIAVEDLPEAADVLPDRLQEIRGMNWARDEIVGWNLWGLTTFFKVVSFLTGAKAGIIYGALGIGFLLLMGKNRAAMVFGAVGLTIGVVAILGDYTLGEVVERGRPPDGPPNPKAAFPSGHVFGSTVFFGFIGFVALYYGMKTKIQLPLLLILAALIVLVGPARIHVQAHWPSDVAAGYLLAALWLLVIIPIFVYLRGTQWMSAWQNKENAGVVACESCMVASSIASVVVLDPGAGTATKVYVPPPVVRILYWVAFQAKFPYETNAAALESGKFRRQIASLLTTHRFGKDLVAR